MKDHFEIDEEIELYYGNKFSKTRLLWELIANADRVINNVYIFKNFDEYCRQLNSDQQEDKLEIYWNASYYEKLICSSVIVPVIIYHCNCKSVEEFFAKVSSV